MSEKPASTARTAATLYLIAGSIFLAVGVIFLLTNQNPAWIAFIALGPVFIVLSATERAKAAKAADPVEPPPANDVPPV